MPCSCERVTLFLLGAILFQTLKALTMQPASISNLLGFGVSSYRVRSVECWRRKSSVFLNLPRKLPGHVLTAEEYCEKLHPKYTGVTVEQVSKRLLNIAECSCEFVITDSASEN